MRQMISPSVNIRTSLIIDIKVDEFECFVVREKQPQFISNPLMRLMLNAIMNIISSDVKNKADIRGIISNIKKIPKINSETVIAIAKTTIISSGRIL